MIYVPGKRRGDGCRESGEGVGTILTRPGKWLFEKTLWISFFFFNELEDRQKNKRRGERMGPWPSVTVNETLLSILFTHFLVYLYWSFIFHLLPSSYYHLSFIHYYFFTYFSYLLFLITYFPFTSFIAVVSVTQSAPPFFFFIKTSSIMLFFIHFFFMYYHFPYSFATAFYFHFFHFLLTELPFLLLPS